MALLKPAVGGVAILITSLFVLGIFAQPGCACSPKWKAYTAAVKSDLRFLVTAQEAVFADDSSYSSVLPAGFAASTGVRVRVVEAGRDGWRAVASHERNQGECRIYVGRVAWRPKAVDGTTGEEGVPVCWGMWPREPSFQLRLQAGLGLVERPRPMPQESVPGAGPGARP